MKTGAVIGAGPAGLMAAETLARAGVAVTVYDAMPSVGRKLLMAGKSGLNITKAEAPEDFIGAFAPLPEALRTALEQFGPAEAAAFAEGLGQELFVGSTGRVFPKVMKASPLLRAWLLRLSALGVAFRIRHRWQGWVDGKLAFDSPDGPLEADADVTVLALGGASWSRLGSDGRWADFFGGAVAPFQPANMGFDVDWSPHMAGFFGHPAKGFALIVDGRKTRGEFVITRHGLEGGGIYAVSRELREGHSLALDLLPDMALDEVAARIAKPQGKASLKDHLRKVLRLDPLRWALLNEFGRPLPADLAALIKHLPVPLVGPRPIDEAISTAGGLRFEALTTGLMLKDRPGVFCAGEMLDWEAPTGGYLIAGCLATGAAAGRAAAQWLSG